MVINYVKLHAEPTEGKTLDISEYKHYWFIPKIPCDNLPVKMKENEMGNQRELKGSTIMHKSSIALTQLLSKLGLLLNIRELTQKDGWKTPDGRMMK